MRTSGELPSHRQGGSLLEAGLQQINAREVGLAGNVRDIENTALMTKTGTPLRVKDIAVVSQAHCRGAANAASALAS